MNEIVRVTKLPVPCERVWARTVTPEGVNYELFPFMKMMFPKAMKRKTIHDAPVGEKLGRSWLLLFGVLPFDFDDIIIAEVEHGRRFLEWSSMFSMEDWEHERTITRQANGCEVRDRIRFRLRRPFSAVAVLEKGVCHFLAARGRIHSLQEPQAKPPAPPWHCNNLQVSVGQAFSLPDFCHGLLGMLFSHRRRRLAKWFRKEQPRR